MDSHEMLVELLAIKLFEHSPMHNGKRHNMSWSDTGVEDRQMYRNQVVKAANPEALYADE